MRPLGFAIAADVLSLTMTPEKKSDVPKMIIEQDK